LTTSVEMGKACGPAGQHYHGIMIIASSKVWLYLMAFKSILHDIQVFKPIKSVQHVMFMIQIIKKLV